MKGKPARVEPDEANCTRHAITFGNTIDSKNIKQIENVLERDLVGSERLAAAATGQLIGQRAAMGNEHWHTADGW